MYRIGRNTKKTSPYIWRGIVLTILALLAGSLYLLVSFLDGDNASSIGEVAITREYVKEIPNNHKTFDLQEFTLSLPNDWVLKNHDTNQANSYTWQATKKYADNRWLVVYVDKLPAKQAYNRMLPITIKDSKVVGTGIVSDNCTAFTGSQGANKPSTPGVETLQTKWQGVSFLCDMSNYTRNVVGVGTENMGTQIKLSGAKTGSHTFLFVYTDHNANPDYQILADALASLKIK